MCWQCRGGMAASSQQCDSSPFRDPLRSLLIGEKITITHREFAICRPNFPDQISMLRFWFMELKFFCQYKIFLFKVQNYLSGPAVNVLGKEIQNFSKFAICNQTFARPDFEIEILVFQTFTQQDEFEKFKYFRWNLSFFDMISGIFKVFLYLRFKMVILEPNICCLGVFDLANLPFADQISDIYSVSL